MAADEPRERILAYIRRRHVTTPQHLANGLGVPEAEISRILDELERQGLVRSGAAHSMNAPGKETAMFWLTPAAEQELARREALSPASEGPVEITREELAAELKRRFSWSDEQIAQHGSLRHSRFTYWPSIGAFQLKRDEEN